MKRSAKVDSRHERVQDSSLVQEALEKAVSEVVCQHERAGHLVPEWHDEPVTWPSSEDLPDLTVTRGGVVKSKSTVRPIPQQNRVRVPSRRPPGRGQRQWVGGRFSAPFHITEGEPYRPTLAVWIEVPDGFVVGYRLCNPSEERGALGRSLTEAMRHPLVGPARRPSRIRVADSQLAAEVKAVVGDLIPVTVGATPELNELLDAMYGSFTSGAGLETGGNRSSEEESYFENSRVSAATVAGLFAAARLLHHVAPWRVANDQQVLRLDIPELGVEGACVSIIGALGQNLGVLIFPSLSGYVSFLKAASRRLPRSSRIDLGTTWLSFTLVRGSDLPASMRREVTDHGWPVADEMSYPQVEHRDKDGLPRPLTDRDVRIASACVTSLSAFFVTNRKAFEAEDCEPICQSYTDDLDRLVRFTFPYEAFPMFDVATGPHPANLHSRGTSLRRNDPCHCGSGKKYKQCHLNADRPTKPNSGETSRG